MTASHQPKVVIVGGGFAGLHAATALRGAPVQVTLVDRRNFHLFSPLLYQVATGALSPANVAAPLRDLLKKQKNARVLLGEAIDFDVSRRKVILRDGELDYIRWFWPLAYTTITLATNNGRRMRPDSRQLKMPRRSGDAS